MLSRWKVEFYNHKKEVFPGLGHARKQKDKKLSELQSLKKELREVKMRSFLI